MGHLNHMGYTDNLFYFFPLKLTPICLGTFPKNQTIANESFMFT